MSIAVVTGAAGGIGRAVVERLCSEGWRVWATDVSAEALACFDGQDSVSTFVHDASSEADWAGLKDAIEAAGERVDCLVNNAGISPKHDGVPHPAQEMPLDEWNLVLAVNLTGPLLGFQTFYDHLVEADHGRVINMASLAGRDGGRIGGVHYTATKSGLIGMTKYLARTCGEDGITFNAIAPGRIDAGMVSMVSDEYNEEYRKRIPVGRLGTAEDIAHAVSFLASPHAGFVTGVTLDVNGGSFMAP